MKIDTTDTPKIGRIVGTLHTRGYSRTVTSRDESLSRERAEESEVVGRHKNNRQKNDQGAC